MRVIIYDDSEVSMKFKSFDEMLLHNAKNHADDTALAYDEDGQIKRLTYATLYEEIQARKAQIEHLDANCVGILQAPSIKWIIDMYACVLARKQTVLLDPMSEAAVIQAQVLATDVETLLTDGLTAPYASKLKIAPSEKVSLADGEGNILFFTSGTTHSSKAVVLTSKSLCASAWNGQAKCPCHASDNLLCMLPLTHVFGFVCAMLWPMSQGACVSMTRGMRYIAKDCDYFKPTIISVVPSILKFLIGFNALNDRLRMILVGAGPATEQMLTAAKAKGIEVRFGYGLTETSSGVAISCGENPFAMSVCPDDDITLGEDGEILIRCPECIMQGYYKNKEATDEVLVDGVLHTGDLGRFDEDGRLYITGRKKDIIVLENGNKIFLPEWENQIAEQLGLEDAALAIKDDAITLFVGNGDGFLNVSLLKDKLAAFNKSKPFNMQITHLEVLPHKLPRTATGKVKRYEL